MSTCTRCGHELGVGRFCTNCGAPVGEPDDWRTDTAERPRVEETVERSPVDDTIESTPVAAGSDSPRFPLFADEVAAPGHEPGPEPAPPVLPPPPPPPAAAAPHRRAAGALPWLVGLAVLALVAVLGVVLLVSGDDATTTAQEEPGRAERTGRTTQPDPSPTETSEAAAQSPASATGAGPPTDLAGSTRVRAPAPAAASRDTGGNVVRYVAANLVDSDPTTAWRMAGDGTGETITFRFSEPVRLRTVGLINGYAKTGSGARGAAIDWYSGNRRIDAVEWAFDDGTTANQSLRRTRTMQTTGVGRVETRTVTLRLVAVTPPGPGRASRDYTAISGVTLVGTTSG